jgi:hypothetical protein
MHQPSRNKTQAAYAKLRIKLIERGITLHGFAITHGYSIPTVYMAARGQRAGVISTKIRKHLENLINDN